MTASSMARSRRCSTPRTGRRVVVGIGSEHHHAHFHERAVETATNANEEAFRKLARAYTMISDFDIETPRRGGLYDRPRPGDCARRPAIGDITQIRAALGTSQERIQNATTRADAQLKVMKEHITSLEAVDPYEAMSNVNALLTQIETAYSLTARLQNLSLINYI